MRHLRRLVVTVACPARRTVSRPLRADLGSLSPSSGWTCNVHTGGPQLRSQPERNEQSGGEPGPLAWHDPLVTSADVLSLVTAGSKQHHDMASFERYTANRGLNRRSTVFVGIHYEYTVSDTLSRYGFDLKRVGRAADKGIDLVGYWHLPASATGLPLRVLGQCKAAKATPSMIRELEGAVVGAPAAWRSKHVLVLLATSSEATKGVREAVSRSKVPMGFVNIISSPNRGIVRQFLWNRAATSIGLEGLNAVVRYDGPATDDMDRELSLTWQNEPWRPISPPS